MGHAVPRLDSAQGLAVLTKPDEDVRARAQKAARWIAVGGSEPEPHVEEKGSFFAFATRGFDFLYTEHFGQRYDDDPWNEVNLSRVEYEPGVHVILTCPRHGLTRWYPYGTVPVEMPPMARYSGQVMRCSFCDDPATFNGNVGSSYRGSPLPTPLCQRCGKVRFGLPAKCHAPEALHHPVYTEQNLREDTESFLAKVKAFNPECDKCVRLVGYGAGYGNITHAMLRRTY